MASIYSSSTSRLTSPMKFFRHCRTIGGRAHSSSSGLPRPVRRTASKKPRQFKFGQHSRLFGHDCRPFGHQCTHRWYTIVASHLHTTASKASPCPALPLCPVSPPMVFMVFPAGWHHGEYEWQDPKSPEEVYAH